ncbi:hypothetical protein [Streptococcus himalayensis]|uniref:Uncharacterized protein n=1 Tax=Streptococcus himalayensis TaxID=1888195 RepID=A0A917A2D2_9STRE|nr:hypothetical protein [Streptococcus himalayensis]GGE23263.1 hypothetical protein GCM10011510_00380 [Streptococcus himalayensis]
MKKIWLILGTMFMVLVAILTPIGIYASWKTGELDLRKASFIFQIYYLSYIYFQHLGRYLAEKSGRVTVLRWIYVVHAVLGFVLYGLSMYVIGKVGLTFSLGLGTMLIIILMLLATMNTLKIKD